MNTSDLVIAQRHGRYLVGIALAFVSCFVSADDWSEGRTLFGTYCSSCHYNTVPGLGTSKAGYSADNIRTGINNQPQMKGISLSDTQLGKIEKFLSTGKHTTLDTAQFPQSGTPPGTPIGSPEAQRRLTLKLKNDGEQSVDVTAVDAKFGAFQVDSRLCSVLSVGSDCDVIVTFNPTTAAPYNQNISVAYDGNSKAVASTATGKGLLNLNIASSLEESFAAALNAETSIRPVLIENWLDENIEICLLGEHGAHGDYRVVVSAVTVLDFQGSPTSPRCTTLNKPGTEFSANLTFRPSEEGTRSASLQVRRLIGSDTPPAPAQLIGNGGPFLSYSRLSGPALEASPLTRGMLFRSTKLDISAQSATTVLSITNLGNEPAALTFSTSGDFISDYVVSGCAGASLAAANTPGSSCNLSVTFDPNPDLPQNRKTRKAELSISYASRTDKIELLGEAFVGPTLEITDQSDSVLADGNATAFDFGGWNINVGQPRDLLLKNLGSDGTLDVETSLVSIGPGTSGFSLSAPATGGCDDLVLGKKQTIAAGAACLLKVTFLPLRLETYASHLVLKSRPTATSTTEVTTRLSLSGVGLDKKPLLSWRDSNNAVASVVAFNGKTAVGEATPLRITLKLDNAPGNGAAALRVLNVVGRDAASFVLDQSAAGSCKAGAGAPAVLEGVGCTVVVVFKPQTAGSKTASLQIDSTGTTPQPILITGEASGPLPGALLSTAPVAVSFSSTRVGTSSATEVVTLTNSGTSPAQVNGIEIDAPFSIVGKTCPDAPFVLAARASCTINLGFAPGANGVTKGSLRVLLDGATTPHVTVLTGEGIPAADLSSGGCSLAAGDTAKDPTLWTLLLLALAALLYRNRQRAAEQRIQSQPGSRR